MKDNETGLTSRIIAKKYRNGKKIMTIVVDYLDEFGKRKQKSKGTGLTIEQYNRDGKRKVESMRQDFVKLVHREQNYVDDFLFNPDKVTLFQFLENFQEKRRNIISITHWENGEAYCLLLKKYLCQQDMPLKKFTHKTLLAFYAHEENRKKKNGEPISKSTLKHIVTYFTTAFLEAWKRDLTTYNLTKYTQMPKVESKQKRFLQEEHYLKLLNMPILDRRDAIVKLAVLLGLRRSELIGLKYSDIDTMANTIFIQRKVLYRADLGFEISGNMKTASSKRVLVLNEFVWEQINWIKIDTEKNKQKLLNLYENEFSEFICVTEFGQLYKPDVISRYMENLCERLEIPYCNFHGLRHTCATILSHTGASAKEAQDYLGHSNLGTTMDTYTHLFQSQREKVSDSVSKFISSKRMRQN